MNAIKTFTFLTITALFLGGCSDKTEIDTEKPSIDLTFAGAFPTSCDTIYFDEPFVLKALLKDNVELGSFNVDIHHNFDQHTHSTEFEQCTLDTLKQAINPFTFIQDYTIPDASSEYTTAVSLTIPASDGTALYDEGDYHIDIRVSDKEGWSTFRGFHIRILHP